MDRNRSGKRLYPKINRKNTNEYNQDFLKKDWLYQGYVTMTGASHLVILIHWRLAGYFRDLLSELAPELNALNRIPNHHAGDYLRNERVLT